MAREAIRSVRAQAGEAIASGRAQAGAAIACGRAQVGEAIACGRAQAGEAGGRQRPAPARSLQVALGAMWLLDGALQLQPFMFRHAFATQIIEPNAAGQPGIVGEPILWMAHHVASHAVLFNSFAAVVQVLIGIGLIWRRTVKIALLGSFAWAFGVWWFGEGLGLLLTGAASPLAGAPGAVLLYAVLGAIVWPRGGARGFDDGGSGGSSGGLAEPIGGLLGPAGARLVWATLWTLMAGLWLVPGNRGPNSTASVLAAAPSGVRWLSSFQHTAASAAVGRGVAIAVVLAIVSAAIAITVLFEWHARPFLVLACLISLAYWVLGEGLGGIFTGSATDPNTGPLFVLLAATIWVLPPTATDARRSADASSPWRGGARSLAWLR